MVSIRETRVFKFWQRYEHHFGVGALATGFFFDLIIADAPDSVGNNLLLLSYLFIAAALIIILNLREMRRKEIEQSSEPFWFLLALQFCFGGLASNLLVLYGKSGTFTTSAIFIVLLIALIFGNEFLRSRYAQLRFNIGIYYFLLLTYTVIAAPTFIFHSIGPGEFLLSGLLSLAVMALFVAVLFALVFKKDRQQQLKQTVLLIFTIFIVFDALYFLHIIPPVPLSLKSIGIYHSVLRSSSGNYLVMYEPQPWYMFWRDTSTTFHYQAGETAYCFSSVYAPARLGAPVYHRWEYYNSSIKRWELVSRISYDIAGGRQEGYRGFSATTGLKPGKWRCNVETASGSLIGRFGFTALEGEKPEVKTSTL